MELDRLAELRNEKKILLKEIVEYTEVLEILTDSLADVEDELSGHELRII